MSRDVTENKKNDRKRRSRVVGTQSTSMGTTQAEREFNKKVSYPYDFTPPKWLYKYFGSK